MDPWRGEKILESIDIVRVESGEVTLWDCWMAFASSESERKRICETIEQVLVPLKEEIESELKAAA